MKASLHHRTLDIVVGIAILALGFFPLRAQESATRQVLILRVVELSKIDLVGGPLILRINAIDVNANEPNPAVDAKTKLLWTSNGDDSKITVGSNHVSSRFTLRLEAESISPGAGLAASEVMLKENQPQDLILGVRRSAGSCTLRFTAVANVEQGTGSESHLVTYTITGG